MFRKLKIGTRLLLANGLILLLVIAVIIPFGLKQVGSLLKESELRELEGLYNIAQGELASKGELAKAMATVVAATPEIQQEFAAGQRDALAERTVPLFQQLKKDYAVRQFQFHTPPATSFLRAHKPEKFGDDLSSFRKTVVETNKTRVPISGLEKGVAGLGIRGLMPIVNQGQHVGSVEFGLSFGQSFFDAFKDQYDVEIALYIPEGSAFKAFGTTMGDQEPVDQQTLQQALSGTAVNTSQTLNELPFNVYSHEVQDFSGNSVGVLVLAKDRSFYVDQVNYIRNASISIGVFALLLGLAISWAIGRSISSPIRTAYEAMRDIARGEGDLTRRLDTSGSDEVSQLSEAFNQFAEKIRQTVSQVAGVTVQLGTAAEQLAVITRETADGVQEQEQETSQVATAMNQMTATVQEVARNAADAATSASKALDETEQGKMVVRSTINSISGLAEEINSAAEVINELETQSENIGSVLDVIRGIAEQTNLLALNAAIEAARAGEQGRGFAVVADEVRTLASRTQQSTEEIQHMIEQLQGGSRQAVKVMHNSNEQVQSTVGQASQAGQSLEDISQVVVAINDMNMQIANAAEEQGLVSEEVNRNVININDAVQKTSSGAAQTSESSDSLASLAADLQQLVQQFRT
jgi:methyl-accepting chemotaxis protein